MYICVWIVWLTNCLNDTLKIGFDRWINVECFLIFGKRDCPIFYLNLIKLNQAIIRLIYSCTRFYSSY